MCCGCPAARTGFRQKLSLPPDRGGTAETDVSRLPRGKVLSSLSVTLAWAARTKGEGRFMAVRSPIMPIVEERSARLETGILRAGQHCLTFYYRMYASYMADMDPETMNKLNVYVMSGDQLGDPLWSIKDGDLWTEAQVSISEARDFQIIFEAEVRSKFKGSIALDDVKIEGGSCEKSCKDSFYGCCMDGVTSAAGPNYQGCRDEPDYFGELPEDSTKIEQFPGKADDSADCDFEKGACAWVQAQQDDLEWVRLKGWSRNVQNTLPARDHTTEKANGWFMTVQSPVRPYYAQVARLQTPTIRSWSGLPEKCLTFHYHMAEMFPDFFPREGTNALNVYATSKQYYDEPVFVANDVMGDQWKRVSVTFSSEKDFQIVFEAIMLSEYAGDISIDDVTVDEGSCEDRHACKRSRYGCCPDAQTDKQTDRQLTMFSPVPDRPTCLQAVPTGTPVSGPDRHACKRSRYGCCPDAQTDKQTDRQLTMFSPVPDRPTRLQAVPTGTPVSGPGTAAVRTHRQTNKETDRQLTMFPFVPRLDRHAYRHACKRSRYGCCPDGRTRKQDASGRGCRYVGRLGADPEGIDTFEERYTEGREREDACLLLGEEFLDCWKRYKATSGQRKAEGRRSDVKAACKEHEDLYNCYYSAVTTLCDENRNYDSFKTALRRDVKYIESNCKNGQRGRRGRARRHYFMPMTPAELMEMLP
ncbi:MALRD1 [Branchiostoma lanceolatum]|uniref:MALRD1 protein n=1 Tax=Branchiostoma lanceolatum TaxID=7740 RepID=A0A8J9WI23_BRALA|nr:MALRD1 [Branchiostoma lanceolatum]